MILKILLGSIVWLIGSAIFFRVWCRRLGRYITTKENVSESPHYTYRVPVDGWYVMGWADSPDPVYSLGTAMRFSFFFWIPVSLIVGIRETVVLLGKTVGILYQAALPSKMHQAPSTILHSGKTDHYMISAIAEVEQIAPENLNPKD